MPSRPDRIMEELAIAKCGVSETEVERAGEAAGVTKVQGERSRISFRQW